MAEDGYVLIDEDNSTEEEESKTWMTERFIKETRSRQQTRWINLSTAKANVGIEAEKQVMIRDNMKEDPCAKYIHLLTLKARRKTGTKGKLLSAHAVAMRDETKNIDRHQILAMIKKQDREEKGEEGHTIAIWVDLDTTKENPENDHDNHQRNTKREKDKRPRRAMAKNSDSQSDTNRTKHRTNTHHRRATNDTLGRKQLQTKRQRTQSYDTATPDKQKHSPNKSTSQEGRRSQ
jgi:hypothetical protein